MNKWKCDEGGWCISAECFDEGECLSARDKASAFEGVALAKTRQPQRDPTCVFTKAGCRMPEKCGAKGYCVWGDAYEGMGQGTSGASVDACIEQSIKDGDYIMTATCNANEGKCPWATKCAPGACKILPTLDTGNPELDRALAQDQEKLVVIGQVDEGFNSRVMNKLGCAACDYGKYGCSCFEGPDKSGIQQQVQELPSPIPLDSQERKELPLFEFLVEYFPEAFVELARFSKFGNDKHNPGERLHWSPGKSQDHMGCVMRHIFEVGGRDEAGFYHDVALAWRALANLTIRLRAEKLGVTYEELQRQYREGERT